MATITVFRQGRADGGVRSGIDYEGMTVLESFEEGAGDDDPALLWYVDVRLSGDPIPAGSPEIVRDWLTQLGKVVQPRLISVATELETGIDGFVPVQRALDVPVPGLQVTLVATGIRRLDARAIAARIREVGEQWQDLLSSVQPLTPAA